VTERGGEINQGVRPLVKSERGRTFLERNEFISIMFDMYVRMSYNLRV